MSPFHAFLTSCLIVVAAKTLAWLIQLRTRNAGLVDAIWAWTLGGLAAFYALVGDAPVTTRWLLGLIGGLWGLRLGMHLFIRNHGKPEDWRYARFRAEWGAAANAKMFWFFQFQNLFTLMLSASAYLTVAYRSEPLAPAAVATALALALISVLGETIADAQMEGFRRNPANRNRVCRDGLWRYSRHPNYFFECLFWTAFVPLALGAPYGLWSLAAPVVMAALLLKLSGVPLMEAEMARRKPGYAQYLRSTSMLIPWFPKED